MTEICGLPIISCVFTCSKQLLNNNTYVQLKFLHLIPTGGRRGPDHMVVGFTTTCAISAYHH